MHPNNNIDNQKLFFQEDYYVDQVSTYKIKTKFNIWAALFGPAWCFYRKLYLVGAVYFLGALILSTTITLLNESIIIMFIIHLIYRLVLGYYANAIYIDRSLEIIDNIAATTEDHETLIIKLKDTGGASEFSVAMYYILTIGLNVCLRLSGIVA